MELKRNSRLIIRKAFSYLKEIDVPLLAAVLALCFFSILNLYGIVGSHSSFFSKQIIFVLIGVGVMTLFSFFNYRYLKNYTLPVLLFYILAVGLLLSVAFFSPAIRGVRSWLVLGGWTFEPAELAKLMVIILMAKYFSRRHTQINQFRHIVASGIYFALPMLIVLFQPDLGSAIIFSVIWGGLLLAAGINKKHLLFLALGALAAAYLGWLFVLKPYQKERVLSFLDPGRDPRGSGYNLIQSKIAIGSGYWLGNGLGKGSQTKLGFLPEPHNDFVIAAVAEQFGWAGVAAVLGTVLFIISRILNVGRWSVSNFGKLFSFGLALFIFSHAFISAAVNVGLVPVTGLPFPFLSYGGSSLISIMIGLGIVQSIKRYG